jgi:peptidoglycan/LPS O-acetylase OafA/YrhL
MTATEKVQANEKNTGTRLAFADGLRAIAALWVVFFHLSISNHIDLIKEKTPKWIVTFFFEWGYLGVPIFFVLSGFVMAYTVRNIEIDCTMAWRFLARRLIRLTPPYYFAIAVMLASMYFKAKILGETIQNQPNLAEIFAHISYLQLFFNSNEISPVFWTLCYEVQFYIIFIILLLISDTKSILPTLQNKRFLVFGAALIVALPWAAHLTNASMWRGDFLKHWYSFLTGVVVCWGWLKSGNFRYSAIAYSLVIILAGCYTQESFTITVGITGALLLASGLLNYMHKWLSWSWIQFVAGISYSLYLLHYPITGVAFRLANKFTPDNSIAEYTGILFMLIFCLTLSWITYLLIEHPSINWSHKFKLKNTA